MHCKSCQWWKYQIGSVNCSVKSSKSPGWADQCMDTVGWHAHLGSKGGLLGGKFRQAKTFIDLLQVVFCQSSLRHAGEGDLLQSHCWIFGLAGWAALGDWYLRDAHLSWLCLNQVPQNGALASGCLVSLCDLCWLNRNCGTDIGFCPRLGRCRRSRIRLGSP